MMNQIKGLTIGRFLASLLIAIELSSFTFGGAQSLSVFNGITNANTHSQGLDDIIQFAESHLRQASISSGNKFLNNLYKHALTKLKVDSDDYEKLEELNDLLKKMKQSEDKVKVMSKLVYPSEKLTESSPVIKKKSKRQKSSPSLPPSSLPASSSSSLKSKRRGETEKREKKAESHNYESKSAASEPVSRSYVSKYARFMEGRASEPSHSSSSLSKSRSKSREYEDDEEAIETYSPPSERASGREKSKKKLRKRL